MDDDQSVPTLAEVNAARDRALEAFRLGGEESVAAYDEYALLASRYRQGVLAADFDAAREKSKRLGQRHG